MARRDPRRPAVSVCAGTGCVACGALKLADAFGRETAARGLADKVDVRINGCHGFCERGPLVLVHPHGFFYQRVRPEDVGEILERSVLAGEQIERLQYVDPVTGARAVRQEDVPFYKHQLRVLLEHAGWIDPTAIDDYLAVGGYRALARVLTGMKPEEVVDLVRRSGLRGRGGGGFPAGVKWQECRKASSAPGGCSAPDGVRYIIGNGDEGDPGAFMDRSLMEGNPHLVIEGMIIGAYAIGTPGTPVGYIYVRHEYPLAVERLTLALGQARELGLLGENILGTGFDFDIRINRGGGAFVCGESTALMASLEGFPGQPRAKYVHTVERGLYGRPTNLNNVETWANVPPIVERGVEWYTSIGTGDVSRDPWGGSKGTKIFALVGKVNNTGLVEVPMGRTLREIIFDIGGGIRDGRAFKAVQTGGPSGGCLPESLLDLPVDFDKLTEAGSMMGSGGMIVMDEGTCMVDVARYFVDFLVAESCGKCVPCREGLTQLSHLLHSIADGTAGEETLAAIEALCEVVRDAGLCALGQTAPNPVRSTIRHFRDEYLAHIRERRCPAAVCKALLTFTINDRCNGCTVCAKECPAAAIAGERKKPHVIDPARCTRCGVCRAVCKVDAVDVR
ncbi:MAG: NADH-ubiquinone oxidoreductase-F iron-sulfur binding region domain-containing protein [Myxococcota bacterium]|nr:NADH-ubiquinone oxidoreductase-F iron-sulfur binding region domain-containing protein [Myxococcota bacterium]